MPLPSLDFLPGGSCLLTLALHFLPICHWCSFSCCPGAESQRMLVCVSPVCCRPFKSSLLRISQFLPPSQPSLCFSQQKLWGLIFLVLKSWAELSGLGSPPIFYPPQMDVGLPIPISVPLLAFPYLSVPFHTSLCLSTCLPLLPI